MTIERFPLIASALTGGRRSRFIAAVEAIEAGVVAGSILNKTYKDARSHLNDAFDGAWTDLVMRDFVWVRPGEGYTMSRAENDFHYTLGLRPEVHTHKTFVKRIAASKLDTPYIAKMVAILNEIEPLVTAALSLADKVQKRETKAQKAERERFQPKPVESAAKLKLTALLTQVAEGARENLTKAFEGAILRHLNTYMNSSLVYYENTPSRPIAYRTPYDHFVGRHHKQRHLQNPEGARDVEPLIVHERYAAPVKRSDFAERARKAAEGHADAVVKAFIAKNLAKLVTIVEAKGNIETAEVVNDAIRGGGMEGWIAFTFKDGSRFAVNNQIVFVENQYGTRFNRFPLTFHGVRLASGAMMKQPSERKMNEEFVK